MARIEQRTAIPTRIEPAAEPDARSPSAIAREFRALVRDGVPIRCVGDARSDPSWLLDGGYSPRYRVDLFDTVFYFAEVRQNPDLRFFVVYLIQRQPRTGKRAIFPRIFYKDVSLIWRSASHLVMTDDELWIGKGDVTRTLSRDGAFETVTSLEATTDLPLEIQAAVETLNRRAEAVAFDIAALALVLRNGPKDRITPYRDFTDPRRRAAENPTNRIHNGRRVAYFRRRGDPSSLRFASGFEPDFSRGILEQTAGSSSMFGGAFRCFRILSKNRRIQYLFFAAPAHVWIIPPQATTIELSSYGVRTLDVVADEDAFLPGYEYHFLDDEQNPPMLHSQIPSGFAGPPNELDPSRADASAWLDALPVIQQFRREVLGS